MPVDLHDRGGARIDRRRLAPRVRLSGRAGLPREVGDSIRERSGRVLLLVRRVPGGRVDLFREPCLVLRPDRRHAIGPSFGEVVEIDVVGRRGLEVDEHQPLRGPVLRADLGSKAAARDVSVVGHPDRHVVPPGIAATCGGDLDQHPAAVRRQVPSGLPIAGREIHGADDVLRVRRPVRLPSDPRGLSSLGGIAQGLEEPSLIRRQALGVLRGRGGVAESEIDRFDRLAGLEIHHDQLAASVQDESAVDLPLDGALRRAGAGHPSKRPIRLEHDQVAVARAGHARAVPVPESVPDEGEPLLRREDP